MNKRERTGLRDSLDGWLKKKRKDVEAAPHDELLGENVTAVVVDDVPRDEPLIRTTSEACSSEHPRSMEEAQRVPVDDKEMPGKLAYFK